MEGYIISSSYGIYSVLGQDQVIYQVPARGIFRLKSKKPVVGDYVNLDETNLVINAIFERKSYLKRPTIANVDQMLLIFSLVEPEFSYLLAFKYLTYANMNNLSCKIILTKKDKFFDEEKLQEIIKTFQTLNIPIYVVSNKTNEGLSEVKELFKGHISVLMGQTGVGKSSLINALSPSFKREIGEYSTALGRGKHQTKEVIILPYLDGYIADTPGFSSLDLELYKEDLAKFFPSFNELYQDCYFNDCLHISENKCAIKMAISEEKIPEVAYQCYLKLSNESIFKNQRYQK